MILVLAFGTVFVDQFVEPLVSTRLRITSTVAVGSLFVSIGVAAFLQNRWGFVDPTWITLFAFASILIGVYLLFQTSGGRNGSSQAAVPLYAPSASSAAVISATSSSLQSLIPFFKHMLREIWYDRESRRIFFFLSINFMFMFVEFVYGLLTNSLGLIADAFHMLFDCTALAIGLWAAVVARWPPTEGFSYGFGRVKVLSGFLNGVFLLFIGSFLLLESFQRLLSPPEIHSDKLLIVSVLGLLVNLVGVWAFHDLHSHGGDDDGHSHGHSHSHAHSHSDHHSAEKTAEKVAEKEAASSGEQEGHSHSHGHSHGHAHGGEDHATSAPVSIKKPKKEEEDHSHHDHGNENAHGVYLHILADTLGSVGVIVSALLIQFFGWTIADPICSGIIAIFILVSTVPLLRDTTATLTERTPKRLDGKIRKALDKISKLENVVGFRDAHFWNCAGSDTIATLHVVVNSKALDQKVLAKCRKILTHSFVDITVEIDRE